VTAKADLASPGLVSVICVKSRLVILLKGLHSVGLKRKPSIQDLAPLRSAYLAQTQEKIQRAAVEGSPFLSMRQLKKRKSGDRA